MAQKSYDITIKEFSKTKLPKAEAPETYLMDQSVNFNLSEDEFRHLLSRLDKNDAVEKELIEKLESFIKK